MSVTLEVSPASIPFGKTPIAIIRNTGDVAIQLKDGYIVEARFDGRWVDVSEIGVGRPACRDGFDSHTIEPGESRSQRITSCDHHGDVSPLPPGAYRITKTVAEASGAASEEVGEATEIAAFEVGSAEGNVPGPRACGALCMSDTTVRPGQNVTVTFDPPRRFIWGVPTELHEGDRQTAIFMALLVGWQDRDERLTTYWPEDKGGYEDIGFRGVGEWKWEVPARLEPGIYALVKQGIREGPAPVPERRRFWTVAFKVVE